MWGNLLVTEVKGQEDVEESFCDRSLKDWKMWENLLVTEVKGQEHVGESVSDIFCQRTGRCGRIFL